MSNSKTGKILSGEPSALGCDVSYADESFGIGQTIVLGIIRAYQLILSPWIGRQCRFYPTCSHYGAEAIRLHGVVTGSRLIIARILRCHPFHPGGVDLVPLTKPQAPR